jgi:hypothetical protein
LGIERHPCPTFYRPHPLPGAGGYDAWMVKRHSITAATIAGVLLVVLDIFNGTPGGFLVSGCILLGAALVAAHSRP